MVDGGGEVFGFQGSVGGVSAGGVAGTEDLSAADAAAGEEDGLASAPVVAAGESGGGEAGDFGGAAEFAGHDDEGLVEEA